MTTDTEHIRLRRRMAARLGRSITSAVWAVATEEGYVQEALDTAYDSAEEGLLDCLRRLLWVQDDAPSSRRQSAPSRLPRELATPALSARIDAVSRLAAEHAAGDAEVIRFRREDLGRDGAMSAQEAEAYLDSPDVSGPSATPASAHGHAEILRYRNRSVSYDLHVWPGTPLDKLRRLAVSLAMSYPWEPAEAAAFVLEGFVPRAAPFVMHLPQTWNPDRPRRARLVMEIDLWVPAHLVQRAYREYQRRVLPGHNRPLGSKSVDLVTCVLRHRPATWPTLLDRWNDEHPDARYPDYRRFRFAFDRAQRSLLHPGYRLLTDP